jgi:hypothetical protein
VATSHLELGQGLRLHFDLSLFGAPNIDRGRDCKTVRNADDLAGSGAVLMNMIGLICGAAPLPGKTRTHRASSVSQDDCPGTMRAMQALKSLGIGRSTTGVRPA